MSSTGIELATLRSLSLRFNQLSYAAAQSYHYLLYKQTFSRFTCSKIAVLFTGSFQAALFSFADLCRNKSFLLAESPFSP